MNEIWKDVAGFEGLYKVSNLGRVMTLRAQTSSGDNIMKKSLYRNGYVRAALYKDGRWHNKLVHRLVAEAFIQNPNNYPCVNHKDEDKTNNLVLVNDDGSVDFEKSNLEWCTYGYNNSYNGKGQRVKKIQRDKGCIYGGRPVFQMTLDGEIINRFETISEAKRQTGITAIDHCCRNTPRFQTAGGFKWKYAD